MFKTILLPTDGSEISNKVVDSAILFAKEHGSKIVGIAVANIYPYFPIAGFEQVTTEYTDAIEKFAETSVSKISKLADQNGIAVEVLVKRGVSPSEEIIKAAEKYKCDVIFMGSHGRKGIDKFLLGSETNKVLLKSNVPVVVFK